MTLVCLSRPLPYPFEVPGAEVRTGPERGFADRAKLLAHYKGADGAVTWVTERVDGEFLDAVGSQLKVVSNYAVGHDNIDISACHERGVVVTNTPHAVTEGTADMAWALLMAAARRLSSMDRFARSGAWSRHGSLGPAEFLGQPLSGRTLFIVGAGRIGYATALRSVGWGMRILYYSRSDHQVFEFAPLNGRRVTLEEGMREADFISVHTPLTHETRHLINAERLALCKPTAVLVNTSRGPVVDEAALAAALREGRLFAAGLDVFEREPEVHPDLAALENVVMAPHIGSATTDSRRRMVELCAANVWAVLAGKPAITPVGGAG